MFDNGLQAIVELSEVYETAQRETLTDPSIADMVKAIDSAAANMRTQILMPMGVEINVASLFTMAVGITLERECNKVTAQSSPVKMLMNALDDSTPHAPMSYMVLAKLAYDFVTT